MKKILSLLVLLPIMVIGQTQTENYIKTTSYKVATATSIATPTIVQATQNITYYDGLGRPIQQVAHQQAVSSTGVVKDIVTPMDYDGFGRQEKDYLPYAPTTTASLDYKPNALTDVVTFYNTAAYENTLNPFSQKEFEKSPLNRVRKQAAPGESWKLGNGHEIKMDYQFNKSGAFDFVKLFKVTANWDASKGLYDIPLQLGDTTWYDYHQLHKTITYDENRVIQTNEVNPLASSIEFKDKEGRIVLKRNFIKKWGFMVEIFDTYYVYDQFGNLTFVIPPAAFENNYFFEPRNWYDISTSILKPEWDILSYQYKYDNRNRLVEKKLPGKDWEFIVYDKLDRVVATGPAFSPFNDASQIGVVGWLITKYDVFNRPVYTGWEASTTINNAGRVAKQNTMNGLTTFSESKTPNPTIIDSLTGITYYTNDVEPKNFKLLTINYYDDYNFGSFTPPTSAYNSPVAYNNTTLKPKGLPTGSWVRVLTTLASTVGESSYILYDAKTRPIRNYTTNYLGGYTQTDSNLNAFSGRLNFTETRHKRLTGDAELYIKEAFTYSDQDRLLTHTHQIGTAGTPQLLASNTYDELGQLISKRVGGQSSSGGVGGGLQKVDYTYNIRGWLKGINNVTNLTESSAPQDLFAFKMGYDLLSSFKPLYNGNISQTQWRSANDNTLRMYNYDYDTLNRLTDAMFSQVGSTQSTGNYREKLSYDKNGNILTLFRTGLFNYTGYDIPLDDLNYAYNGSHLAAVSDASNVASGFEDGNSSGIDYMYDANGNMIADKNKGITNIIYNHLNLPTKITFGTGSPITYLYNALGQKLEKVVIVYNTKTKATTNTATKYLGGFQYTTISKTHPTIHYATINELIFPQAEGYVKNATFPSSIFNYVYNYTDHLGNIRLSYQDINSDGAITNSEILEESNYYPFGMKHEGYNSNNLQPNYKYKYNGKELQDELGLNMYDYGARNYDPAIGRWMNLDPLAEMSRRWSPYSYAYDSPLRFIDPDGMFSTPWDYADIDQRNPGWARNDKGSLNEENEDGANRPDQDENKADKNGAESETDSMDSRNDESKSKESAAYPDPKSFKFKSLKVWQESAVVGLNFRIALIHITPAGVKVRIEEVIYFPQAILFTVPLNLTIGNTNIDNEVASSATANIINRVMSETASLFAGTEATQMQVEQYFRTELKREYQMSIPGARVNFNSMNHSVKPTVFRHK